MLTGRSYPGGPAIEHSEATAWAVWVLFAAGVLAVGTGIGLILGRRPGAGRGGPVNPDR